MSTDAVLSADTAETQVPTGQQPAVDAGASFDHAPSISALDQFLNQPIRPELAGVSTTVDNQAPADPALGTQTETVQDLDFTDLIKADQDAQRFLESKYNGDPVQFAKAGIEAMKALSRRDEEAAQWRAYQNQLAQQQRIPQQQVQAPAPPAQPKSPIGVELTEAEWAMLEQRDDEGKAVAPPELIAKYKAYQSGLNRFVRQLATDPYKTLGLKSPAEQEAEIRKAAQQELGQYSAQQTAQQFIADNQGWMLDQSNPNQLSQYGQVFAREVQTLAARGVPQDLQIELGKRAVNEMYYRQQAEQAAIQNQQRVQQNQPPRPNQQAAVHSPNAAGPTPSNPMALYKPGEDLEEALRRNLGILGHKLDHFQ